MQYLYHGVPKDLVGDTLYPLNQLKQIHPELYEAKVAKYDGRKGILERNIPTLGCLWNDVLHLTAVHPKVLVETLAEARRPVGDSMRFYQIDPRSLDPVNTTIYLYTYREKGVDVPESDFVPYSMEDLSSCAVIPDFTKDYYTEQYSCDKQPLLYHGVPHILYKGTIDVSDLPIVAV